MAVRCGDNNVSYVGIGKRMTVAEILRTGKYQYLKYLKIVWNKTVQETDHK